MLTGQTMSMAETLTVSGPGLLVVFAVLAALAVAIVMISKALGLSLKKPEAPKAADSVPAIDEETYAVLIAAVTEEARLAGDVIRVTSIKEI